MPQTNSVTQNRDRGSEQERIERRPISRGTPLPGKAVTGHERPRQRQIIVRIIERPRSAKHHRRAEEHAQHNDGPEGKENATVKHQFLALTRVMRDRAFGTV